jgi:hypothetical protein
MGYEIFYIHTAGAFVSMKLSSLNFLWPQNIYQFIRIINYNPRRLLLQFTNIFLSRYIFVFDTNGWNKKKLFIWIKELLIDLINILNESFNR